MAALRCVIIYLLSSILSEAIQAWDIPTEPSAFTAPTQNEDVRDSFSSINRGRFGPTRCPDKMEVSSLNITANYSGSIRELKGVSGDLGVFKKITDLVSNVSQSRELALNESETKTSFLNYIKRFSNGKSFINFNFAGHGETIEGKHYILLPGYFKCLNNFKGKRSLVSACGEYLVTGQEVENAMKGSYVFGIINSCKSGDLARDMSNSSMIAGSEPGKNILDDYGRFAEGWSAAELQNAFNGSELAGRINDLLSREVTCEESVSRTGQVTFADIPALIPKSDFFRDRPSGHNVRDAINSCFVLKPERTDCPRPGLRQAPSTNLRPSTTAQ